MQIPVPRTVEGARRLGRAINAQFRAERWASRRRWTSALALAGGLVLGVDNMLPLLPGQARHAVVVGWWVMLGAAVVAAVIEAWSTLRMQRALEEAADA